MDPTIQRLSVQLKTIKQVYKRTGNRLEAWWAQQDAAKRQTFLLEWCPYMPLARDKPYLYVDGKKEDVHVAALIVPEVNQQELLQGNRLLELIRQVAEVPDQHEPGGHPGYDALTELCLRNIPKAEALVGKIKTGLPRQEYSNGMVMLMPGADFGKMYVVKQMTASIRGMFQQGTVTSAPTFEALAMRLDLLLSTLALCLDHYWVEVLGRKQYVAIGPQMGCGFCGALEAQQGELSGSGKLQACAACGVVFYCSKACQKSDWKEHKPHCKPKELRDKEAAAAAGSSDPAGGSSAVEQSSSAADAAAAVGTS